MAAITTRQTAGIGATVAGVPLTNAQLDNNFININLDLPQKFTVSSGQGVGTNVYYGIILDTGTLWTTDHVGKLEYRLISYGSGGGANGPALDHEIGGYISYYRYPTNGDEVAAAIIDKTHRVYTPVAATVYIVKIKSNGNLGIAFDFGMNSFSNLYITRLIAAITNVGSANWSVHSRYFTSADLMTALNNSTNFFYVDFANTINSILYTTSSLPAANLTGTISGDRGVTAGSSVVSFVEYNGTTKTAGQFDGGATAPTNTTRLNYDGNFYATNFFGNGSNLTNLSVSALGSQTANTVLAAPNGSAGTPTFRALVSGDIPTLNQNTTGSAGSVANSVTFNNAGSGATSGSTFNGSAAVTISHNTIGATRRSGITTSPESSVISADIRTLTNPTTGLGYFGGVRFRFSSLNDDNSTPYADVIDLSTYTDSSGGGFNALYFGKNSQTIQHKYASAGITTWTTKTLAYTDTTIFIGTSSFALNRASAVQSLTGVSIDGNAGTVTNGVYTTGDQSIAGVKTLTGPLVSPRVNIERVNNTASGISWYNRATYTSWADYMAQAGQTSVGPTGNITAPSGTLVTSWGLRRFIENVAGYGWTFESGTVSQTTPTVVAEIRSSDGAARFGGAVTAPNFADSIGTYNANIGSGGTEARGVAAGYSGGSYGGIGYNIRHTASSDSYIAPLSDTVSYLRFDTGGFRFFSSAAGTAGRALSLTAGNSIAFLSSTGNLNVSGNITATGTIVGDFVVSVINTSTTAVHGTVYILTSSLTLTLPASPAVGDWVRVSNRSGTTTAVIARNGQNIMSLAEDMIVDTLNATLTLVYASATLGWTLI